jgi:hypothetical protein
LEIYHEQDHQLHRHPDCRSAVLRHRRSRHPRPGSPNGTETDLLSHLDEVNPTNDVTSGERIVGEQDNADDLIYQAS